jgi:NAD+ synthase
MQNKIQQILDFIGSTVSETGLKKVILGISGGLDSAVVATLCQRSLGSENVIGVMMPYRTSSPDSLAHAMILANELAIEYKIVPITDMVDAYFETNYQDASPLRRGNYMARMRMSVLYDMSAKNHALVVGTSNISEIYTGYCTIYGDAACAFEPIGHLYKTEVFELANLLNVPDVIIKKRPSADLWIGQSDEDDLGITYTRLDQILQLMFVEKLNKKEQFSLGITESEYEIVTRKINSSKFKRQMPTMMYKNGWILDEE